MKNLIFTLMMFTILNVTFAQSKPNIHCRIWHATNYCQAPDSVVYFKTVYCKSCTTDYYPCACFNRDDNVTAVWLTMTGDWTSMTLNKSASFNLTSHFKNISLIKKNTGKTKHPYVILLEGNPDYMKSKFRAKEYLVTYDQSKRFDLIVIFFDAEKGDTFKIDGFIQAEIK